MILDRSMHGGGMDSYEHIVRDDFTWNKNIRLGSFNIVGYIWPQPGQLRQIGRNGAPGWASWLGHLAGIVPWYSMCFKDVHIFHDTMIFSWFSPWYRWLFMVIPWEFHRIPWVFSARDSWMSFDQEIALVIRSLLDLQLQYFGEPGKSPRLGRHHPFGTCLLILLYCTVLYCGLHYITPYNIRRDRVR